LGLLQLANPVARRMMMDEGKNAIAGLEPRANMNFVDGRPTQNDETLFGFAAYRERNHDGTSLNNQVGRLVFMVVSPTRIDRWADVRYITLEATEDGALLQAVPSCSPFFGQHPKWSGYTMGLRGRSACGHP
jgi:hypothetical protein